MVKLDEIIYQERRAHFLLHGLLRPLMVLLMDSNLNHHKLLHEIYLLFLF